MPKLQHSVKVPQLYKAASKIAKIVKEEGGSLKDLVFSYNKHLASCLASKLLNPPPGSVTLDMCAAPGMKTTHLASLMKNKGTLYAVEMGQKRYQTLCNQVEKSGATCVKTLHCDALTLDSTQCPGVQYILVDPSCSGS
ncbi:hypothetical protein ANN_07165, partial [Periplaneta americana]